MACPTHSGTWRRYADAVSVDAPNRSKPWGAPRDDLQGESNSCRYETLGIGHVLIEEEIDDADADPYRWLVCHTVAPHVHCKRWRG